MTVVLPLAFYGSLALLALWATWRDFDLRWIGAWLVAGYVLSNALFFTVAVAHRVGPYSFIEVMVAVTAMSAWTEHRYRALIGIVVFNLASIGANIAFAVHFPPSQRQIFLWEVTTNICFAAECLIATGVGIAHGYRTGRFSRRLRDSGIDAQPDAAREGKPWS